MTTNVNPPKPNGMAAQRILGMIAQHDTMQRIRPASLFNLNVAARAMGTEGVGGVLTIQIPAKAGGQVEIGYSSSI